MALLARSEDDDDDDDEPEGFDLPPQVKADIMDALSKFADTSEPGMYMVVRGRSTNGTMPQNETNQLKNFVRSVVSKLGPPAQGQARGNRQNMRVVEFDYDDDDTDKEEAKPKKKKKEDSLSKVRTFDMRPKEVREYLDRYVVQQDEAKKVLSVAICDHYNVVRRCIEDPKERETEYSKPNILVLGPTGSGKTYVVRTLAKLLGVPFVKADATKFTEAGIVGEDAEDLVRQLVDQADGDTALAQYGIIYVDEVDKLCKGGGDLHGGISTSGLAPSQRGVQASFLKVMEDTEVSVQKMSGIPEIFLKQRGPSRISTKHILFIFSGAFTGLDEKLRREAEKKSIGFNAEDVADDTKGPPVSYLGKASSADFVQAGLEPEFIGRIPVRVAVQLLDTAALEQILRSSEGSVLRQYERDFKGYGIDVTIENSFLRAVAEAAAEEKTGARGLVTVLERTFREFKYHLPSTSITSFRCTARTVQDPQGTLQKLLKRPAEGDDKLRLEDLTKFKAHVQDIINDDNDGPTVTVDFDEDATDFLISESRKTDTSVRTLCAKYFDLFKNPTIEKNPLLQAMKRRGGLIVVPVELFLDREHLLQSWRPQGSRAVRIQSSATQAPPVDSR